MMVTGLAACLGIWMVASEASACRTTKHGSAPALAGSLRILLWAPQLPCRTGFASLRHSPLLLLCASHRDAKAHTRSGAGGGANRRYSNTSYSFRRSLPLGARIGL